MSSVDELKGLYRLNRLIPRRSQTMQYIKVPLAIIKKLLNTGQRWIHRQQRRMIRKTLPKARLAIPQVLAQQRRPIVTFIITATLYMVMAMHGFCLRLLHRIGMERIQESLNRRCGFVKKSVVRIARFHDRPDLYLRHEDA